ncbi:MAG: Bacterial Ig-like domain (group 1) [Methanocella sp. PtaU1.Bin125]|nr:MAG: Bacterial Ig-like domain (group 1) [Methanocella sp. PtaU1.Bin125]
MSRIRQLSVPISILLIALIFIIAEEPAGAQMSLPDGVKFVDPSSVLRAGGAEYTITVQLKIHDADYPLNGIGVYFESTNPSVLDIGRGTFVMTDSSGRASLNVVTGPNTGNVTVTAVLMSTDGDVRASKNYTVKGFGNVSGTVVDAAGKGIPGASVTLYLLNNSSKSSIVQVPGNPATTAGADAAVPGFYAINDVPYGSYYLEAIKDNQIAALTLTLASTDVSGNIALQGYYLPTPAPTPAPTLEPTPTATPVPPTPTPGAKSTGDPLKQAAWIIGAAIVLAVIIVAVQLMRKKR